jgi:hypothetical protein
MADAISNPVSEPKRKYKLLNGMHRTGSVVYRAGDTLELTKSQAEALGDRVEPASGTTGVKKEDTGTGVTDSIPNPNVEKPPVSSPTPAPATNKAKG